ncbi:MAG: DUF72 domain-containing protein [Planctomycetes bacterium]|nr:DUF72 domain-containing protein [Planctomycetota bacterium]
MDKNHQIQIGCCGWSYDDWLGQLYAPGTKPGEYLGQYAQRYDIVEVDSTFYRTPTNRMVEGWHERTPNHFRFSLKLPQVITHEKMMRDCQEELDGFLAVAQLLGEKLHSVCLQFGYFNRQKFTGVRQFLDVLDPFLERWPRDVAVAVEIRNRNWLVRDYFDCLRRHGAATVIVLQSWMPSPAELIERFDVVTGPFAYVRLLGDRQGIEAITTTWNKIVIDKSDELRRTAAAIQRLAQRVPVLAFVNNHYAGYAPETAEMLRQVLSAPEAGQHKD